MKPQWTPIRWPAAWKDPATVALLKDTPINCLLVESGGDLEPVAERAKQNGLAVMSSAPAGVHMSKGEWPGIQMGSRDGGGASAGPTGAPWLDANGWRVRLDGARHPEAAVWVDAPPKGPRVFPGAFAMAFIDSAAFGGRWIISLDDATAAGIAAREPQSMEGWNQLAAAARLFEARKEWTDYAPEAVIGVVSDFSASNEFLGSEALNLLARANQQYRVILKGRTAADSWKGLRAVLYVDAQPPSAELRRQIEALVAGGTMLIAGPKWGAVGGAPAKDQEHPRYEIRAMGKGKVAIARAEPDDPYVLANDAILLMSHRYELVRFFNVGAVNAYLTASADRRNVLLQMLFYTDRGPRDASVRIAGRCRSARLWTADGREPQRLELHPGRDGVELYLPPVVQYAAAELEV